MAVLVSFQNEFLVIRDAVWNSIVVNEAFPNPTHGNAGRSSAGRAKCCSFHDNVLRSGATSGAQVYSLSLAGRHSCCVATWLLETSSSTAVLWLAFAWAQILHSCSVSILRDSSTYLFPQTSLLPTFQPCLFQVLDRWPKHHLLSRNRCSCIHWPPLFRQSESPWAWLSPAHWEEFPFLLFFRETLGYSSNTMAMHFCVVLAYHTVCPTSMSHFLLAKRNPILFKYPQQYARGRWTQSRGKNYNWWTHILVIDLGVVTWPSSGQWGLAGSLGLLEEILSFW